MKPDFAAEFVALAREIADVSPDAGARLEAELRARYAGTQVRIAERPPVTLERINEVLRQGKPVRLVADELGVSRMTIYRHLGSAKKSQSAR